MFCSNCGTQLADGSKFCMQCGAQLAAPAAPAAEAPAYEAPAAPAYEAPAAPAYQAPAYQQPVYPQQPVYGQPAPEASKKKSKKVLLIVGIAVLALILAITAIAVGAKLGGKSRLERMLLEDWSRVENDGDLYFELVLDFEEGYVDYLFESAYLNDTIATLNYEVISGNEIMVPEHGNAVYTITFNDDQTMMTITPAMTSTEPFEYWFNLD
ncbi:MAG: zinc ribbon domain-containing protein [Clostridia bacterium]|nr:zinc ribbon domain-containing protein [Clostridia bacterium]